MRVAGSGGRVGTFDARGWRGGVQGEAGGFETLRAGLAGCVRGARVMKSSGFDGGCSANIYTTFTSILYKV